MSKRDVIFGKVNEGDKMYESEIIDGDESSDESSDIYGKSSSRTRYSSFSKAPLALTSVNNVYLMAHLSHADLSMLSDHNDFKEELNIIQKNYTTFGCMKRYGYNIYVRDTQLLFRGRSKLSDIGIVYNLEKIDIPKERLSDMEKFQIEDPELFEKYAVRDAEITLVHGVTMEEFNHTFCRLGVPLSISKLAEDYVKKV
jgi:hypothetical protein